MKDQGEYTEEDRIYGAWLGVRSRIHKIDYGQADEDFPGQRSVLYGEMEDLAAKYREITGRSISHG